MQVRDLLHTQPAELTATHSAGHVITAPIVHLNDVGRTAGTWLYVIGFRDTRQRLKPLLVEMYEISNVFTPSLVYSFGTNYSM